jgi:hypothetical protein
MYLSLAKDNRIIAYQENDSHWEDAGKLNK